MINANLYSVCESHDGVKGYSILLSVVSLNKEFDSYLSHVDKLLDLLYGKESEYHKKTKRNIIKVNSLNFCNDYYIPCDIGLIIDILELFTCMRETNAFLGNDFINREQLLRINRREFYFFVSEFVKNRIINLQKEEKQSLLFHC